MVWRRSVPSKRIRRSRRGGAKLSMSRQDCDIIFAAKKPRGSWKYSFCKHRYPFAYMQLPREFDNTKTKRHTDWLRRRFRGTRQQNAMIDDAFNKMKNNVQRELRHHRNLEKDKLISQFRKTKEEIVDECLQPSPDALALKKMEKVCSEIGHALISDFGLRVEDLYALNITLSHPGVLGF